MSYEYAGVLKRLLPSPDPAERDGLESVVFSAADLREWTARDMRKEHEWDKIPTSHTVTPGGIRIQGRFDDLRQMDSLSPDDPQFWAPLGSIGVKSGPFPIDVTKYPIAEITYLCNTPNAHPAWVWVYPTGYYLNHLPRARRQMTVAQHVSHMGFPTQIDAVVLRLYSSARSTESMEVQSIRFRVMTPSEAQAIQHADRILWESAKPPRYQVLEDFMPLGTVMNAETARRMTEMLGIRSSEYWELAFTDMVRYHHNCVALESGDRMSPAEWEEMLDWAQRTGLRVLPIYDFPNSPDLAGMTEFIEERITPYANSSSVLGWCLSASPDPADLDDLLRAKTLIEQADRKHPVAVFAGHPGPYAHFAPHFAASGTSHYLSHGPHEFGEMARTHAALCKGQQMWVVAPGFIHATGWPDWNGCAEMRLMANLAIAGGARGWFTYAYHNDPIWVSGSLQRSLTGPFLAFSDLWLELDKRIERLNALAPLFLNAIPEQLPDNWYISSLQTSEHTQLPEGVQAISAFRMRGLDYDLYILINNDTRGPASINITIPAEALHGLEVYDLSDFIQVKTWIPMNLERHLEMFPGQARAILVAPADTCALWRDEIARIMIQSGRQMLNFNLRFAHSYGLSTSFIDDLARRAERGADPLSDLCLMDTAVDKLVDLLYETPALAEPRSRISEVQAAICACDGALCRMMMRGKVDRAHEFGLSVLPLARELTHLRLELRQGRGAELASQGDALIKKALELLAQIRAAT